MDLSILIVDDDPELGDFIARCIRRESPNCSISVVESGKECLEHIKSNHVDCILSDYQMPGMNGMELLSALRAQENSTPFIFITAQGNEQVARDAFMNGADDYFTKDIGFAHFARIINSAEQSVRRRVAEEQHRLADISLRESEVCIRRKLESLLSPEGDIGDLDLEDILDVPALQSLMDDFFKISRFPMALIDLEGKVLVGVGWQDICTRFHRANPETLRHCLESDTQLTIGIPAGEFRRYKCMNGLWDMATPLIIGERHVGNVFAGQFFLEGEAVDCEMFRSKARQYGFNEEKYMAALDAIQRLSPESVEAGMSFLTKLAQKLSQLGYSNIKLAQSLAESEALTEALKDSEERFRTLFESADDGIFLQEYGVFVDCNSKGVEMYGSLDKGEIIGHRPAEFAPAVQPDGRASEEKAIGYVTAALDGEPQRFYWQTYRKDGTLLDVEISLNRLSLGSKKYIQAIVRDVTYAKMLERQRADLYSMVTHDLKSPIAAILGHIELLASNAGEHDADTAVCIDSVRKSCKKLYALIDGFLSVSRLEAGKLEPQFSQNDIYLTIRDALDGLEKISKGKGLALNVDIEDVLRTEATLDHDLVRRAILNLLQNAVSYTPAGGAVTLRASTRNEGGRDFVEVSVADTGIGVQSDEQARVFDKYYRSPRTMNVRGAGLGLFMVRSVAEAHGGRVEIESGPGKGSTFRLILPLIPRPT